jgi:hypothetical protein
VYHGKVKYAARARLGTPLLAALGERLSLPNAVIVTSPIR